MKAAGFPFAFVFAVAILLQVSPALARELCPGVFLDAEVVPALDANETTLICGSPPQEQLAEGWEKIPKNQAFFRAAAI